MLAAVSVWGFRIGATPAVRWLLGFGAPLLIAVFWGLFMAPQAAVPVSPGLHLGLELALYALAALALLAASLPLWAAVFAVLALANTLALWYLGA